MKKSNFAPIEITQPKRLPTKPYLIPSDVTHSKRLYFSMSEEQIDFLWRLHVKGMTAVQMKESYRMEYGKKIDIGLVEQVIKEQGLPMFLAADKHKCSGCGKDIVCKPCVACTLKKRKRKPDEC